MSESQEINTNHTATSPYIFRRFIAGFIDYSIVLTFLIVYIYTFGEQTNKGYSITGFATLIPMMFWIIMTAGVEQLMGATLGNLIVSLKPVSINNPTNQKVSFSQSLKRHLLAPIDMFLFGIIGIIVLTNTPKHQRIGDLWAHTIVIKEVD